jgi:hypothetical protein
LFQQPTHGAVIIHNTGPPPDYMVVSIVSMFCCFCIGIFAMLKSIRVRNPLSGNVPAYALLFILLCLQQMIWLIKGRVHSVDPLSGNPRWCAVLYYFILSNARWFYMSRESAATQLVYATNIKLTNNNWFFIYFSSPVNCTEPGTTLVHKKWDCEQRNLPMLEFLLQFVSTSPLFYCVLF